MRKLILHVAHLDASSAQGFEHACTAIEGVQRVDTWQGKAEITLTDAARDAHVVSSLRDAGYAITPSMCDTTVVTIDGMHCRSCEVTIEKKFAALPGVERVTVNAARGRAVIETIGPKPDLATLGELIKEDGYTVHAGRASAHRERPSPASALGAIVIVSAALFVGARFGLFSGEYGIAGAITFGAAVMLGLVAGSSSCLAVSGGLMLSMAAKYRMHSPGAGMRPVLLFVAGRIVSYAAFGALIGLLGAALTPSPFVTGFITLVAATVMIIMGLDMLGLAPAALIDALPRLPRRLTHRITDAEERGATPILLGAATFFIPCGFTQALQVYALTSGGAVPAATVLGGFAIGTAPALLALGWASGSLKGRAGDVFLRFAGALVFMLGLWNVQNGITLLGFPVAMPAFGPVRTAQGADPNVQMIDGEQVISLTLTARDPYYAPANRFTVKKDVPVRLIINGVGMGCRSQFQIPRFGVSLPLTTSQSTVTFTPDRIGSAAFSCAMGMYPGIIDVI